MGVCFWGAGAIGSLHAAFAARAGEEILLVDIDESHVDAMNAGGLRVVGFAEFSVPVRAALPAQVIGPLDIVVLSVKSQHTIEALRQLAPLLGPGSVVVSLQNGVNPPTIAERVGVDRTVGALVGLSGDLLEPGVVRLGRLHRCYIGCLEPSARASARLAEVQRVLGHTVPVTITDNVLGYLWCKQCSCSLQVATTLSDEPSADVLSSPLGLTVIHALLSEAVRAADALGLKLEPCEQLDPDDFRSANPRPGYEFLRQTAERVRGSHKPHSGMWRDIVVRKRRSETEFLIGPLVRRAQAAGVSIALNARMLDQIAEIEDGTRAQGWHNFEELAQLMRRAV